MSIRARGRRPGKSTTREEIVLATAEIVQTDGINQATARAIAARAGVDPALIYRHFGSKDELLDEVFRRIFASMPGFDRPVTNGRQLVEFALDLWENPARRMIGMSAIRSATSNDRAAAMVRELVMRNMLPRISESVRDDRRELRTSMIAAQVVGIVLVRHGIKLPGLTRAKRDEIVRVAAPVIEHYLHGDLGLDPR